MRPKVLLLGVLIVAVMSVVITLLWPEPEPEIVEEEPVQDTGLTRQQVEDQMRAIGYVQ